MHYRYNPSPKDGAEADGQRLIAADDFAHRHDARHYVLVLRASDALSTSLSQAATELTRDFHQALGCIDE
ncbi:hypothetical protein PR002_g3348 [Phytophthora rubi]|uniref:Uncharacterized protein n=1 Tax=Phytophthora rubi TaxID=129364 RepID=A0A6A3NIS2_9STRA|nr:hypothetical protein PR002_g3348 [Phytophthora rubi]